MKRLILAGLALALTACAATVPVAADPTPPPAQTAPVATSTPAAATGVIAKADTVILTGSRAFAAAELAYISAAQAVGVAADHGALPAPLAAQLRVWNADARTALVAGKATSDGARKASEAAKLFGIADRLNALIGRK